MGRGSGSGPRRRSGADDEGWSDDERRLVDYLRSLGHEVEKIPESSTQGMKTADALVDMVPTEFKTLDSNEVRWTKGRPAATGNSLVNAVKRSAGQARSVIVDIRKVPIGEEDARTAIRRIRNSPQISSGQVRFVGRDFDITGDVS